MQTDQQTANQSPKPKYPNRYPKGRSGNPRGRPDGRRYREAFAGLAAEYGGEASLTPTQRLLIDEIAGLKAGKRNHSRSNTIAKLMEQLAATRREPPAKVTVRDYAASKSGAKR